MTRDDALYALGLYGSGMHDFICDEAELGTRVAEGLDDEALGFGALFDLHVRITQAITRLDQGYDRGTR